MTMCHRIFLCKELLKVNILTSFLLYMKYFEGVLCLRFNTPSSMYFIFCCSVVADLEPGPGIHSSVESDVFICEQVVNTSVQDSDASFALYVDSARSFRTQHGRATVGLEPSVPHNAWGRSIVSHFQYFACFFVY